MTREETKKRFKSWCQGHIGNSASDEDYQMFNNIMALLEQEPKTDILDKIRAEISEQSKMHLDGDLYIKMSRCMQIIDKYKAGEE